ncbi:sigma factor [Fictibacillus nanhaiensis]|uniref:RNA polymerase sigma factor n=1 Tax=Fictibacillus nanhaiensis TaxID=742169 RepID=UPI002E21107D|nr:sigma factor [Fictibacillus nanhaiensis]MED1865271.1 sigma factor [Fictibacillus nanhaiensis]
MNIRHDLDRNVLNRLHHKDSSALKQMIDSYSTLLFHVALRITGDKRVAEQVLCEVFRDLWDNSDHYTKVKDKFLSSYLIRLCKLKCVDREEIHITHLLSKKSKNYVAHNATI